MKIIIVHPFFYVCGGAEKCILDWFVRMQKDNSVELYTLFDDSHLNDFKNVFFSEKNVPKISKILPLKVFPFFYKKELLNLAKKLANNVKKDDVILLSNFPATLILNEAIKLNPNIKNNKILFFCFEPDRILYYEELKKNKILPRDLFSKKLWLLSRLISRLKRADQKIINKYVGKVTTISNVLVDVTKSIYQKKEVEKITEVYASKTQLISRSKAREELNKHFDLELEDSDFIILSLGRIEKTKGLEELLSIVKKINEENKISVKLLIGGTGKLFEHFKNEVKKLNNVHLLGFIPDNLMNYFYCSGNLFVFLGSKHLAGPLTLIEAMYAKNMCIASNNGSPPEVITDGKNGFLVDPENFAEVENKIELCYDLWQKGKDKTLCDAARKKIDDKFGFEKNYSSLIKSFGKILNKDFK